MCFAFTCYCLSDKLTLFMKNLPFEADEDKIKEVFPNATEVRLAKRPDGSLRG